MKEKKCFICRGFGHITCYCIKIGEKKSILMSLNRFEVLKSRVMNKGEGSRSEVEEDRKTILTEEKLKKKTAEV